MLNLSIWASGNGSNAENIINYFENNQDIQIKHILCNNASAGVIERAKRLGVPCHVFSRKEFSESEKIFNILLSDDIHFIILSGFLQMVPSVIVATYRNKILNIHPALLPKFGGKGMYGMNVHKAVIAASEIESGITIHIVNNEYDKGRIIMQAGFTIEPCDTPETIAEKVHALEYKHFPKVINDFVLFHQYNT